LVLGFGLVIGISLLPTSSHANNPPNSPWLCGLYNRGGTAIIVKISWTFSDPDDGDTQSAYQILVATTSSNLDADNGDMWDSGKVDSSLSENIPYAGPALAPVTTYYFKLRTWDNHDAQSNYSPIYDFTTLTLRDTDDDDDDEWYECAIATAAYGGYTDKHGFITDSHRSQIAILCRFRDEYLLTNKPGQELVKFYYRYSPRVADFIRDKEPLRTVVRIGLKPIV